MVRWQQFAEQAPALAEAGRGLIYQFGTGLGYLATVRADGGPRMHPFCPVLYEGGLYGLIVPSPKQRDLLRDGRIAFHTFPAIEVDDEFYFDGRARYVADAALRERVREAFLAQEGTHSSGDEELFELEVERVLLTRYEKRPSTTPPRHEKWPG